VLTFLGNTFSARMGGSLLRAVGLPELICDSQKAYEDLAIALGLNPSRCTAIKEKLAANRLNTLLFNINAFTQSLENALMQAYSLYIHESAPENIFIQ